MADLAHPTEASAALRAAGLRITQQRLAVLDVLRAHPHATAELIERRVRETSPISTQAVYDVLAALESVDLVRRIQPAGSPAVFERRVLDNHHHLICRSCGVIVDVDCAVGFAPCLTPSNVGGFVIDEAEVVYWGLCPDCRAAAGRLTETSGSHPATGSLPSVPSEP